MREQPEFDEAEFKKAIAWSDADSDTAEDLSDEDLEAERQRQRETASQWQAHREEAPMFLTQM